MYTEQIACQNEHQQCSFVQDFFACRFGLGAKRVAVNLTGREIATEIALGKIGAPPPLPDAGIEGGVFPQKDIFSGTIHLTHLSQGAIITIADKQPALNFGVFPVASLPSLSLDPWAQKLRRIHDALFFETSRPSTPLAIRGFCPCIFSDRRFTGHSEHPREESGWAISLSGRRKTMESAP